MRMNLFPKMLKRSLSRKITTLSFILFFFLFSIFTIIVYSYANKLLLYKERENISLTVENISVHLSDTDDNLTLNTLEDLFNKQLSEQDSSDNKDNQLFPKTQYSLGSLISPNQSVQIFNVEKQLLLTTNSHLIVSEPDVFNKIYTYNSNGIEGYVINEKIYSNQTKKLVGFVSLFYSLEPYHKMRKQLLILLLIIELVGITLSVLLLYFFTKYFFKPIKNLHQIMTKIDESPNNLNLRSQIHSGDEIEELSNIFDAMLDHIEDYTHRQSQFISDVSHELRTPVAVIKGHIGMLQRWGKEDPEILNTSLDAAQREAERKSIMINDMLTMVRVQGDFTQYQGEVTNIKESIESVFDNFRVLQEDFSFIVNTEVNADIYIGMYKNHFEQALTILVDNAIKYSPTTKEISIYLEIKHDKVVLHVKDRGEGISQEDIKHIFERFYRTDKSRNRTSTQAGLGIGLSILKQIVDANQIELTVDSVLGEGTEFILKIPKA